jgi:small conductance mechanosensitive channel
MKKSEIEKLNKENQEKIAKETKKSVDDVRNRLLASKGLNEPAPTEELRWRDLPTKKKCSLIVSWVLLFAAIAYVIITANSPSWWGDDCILSRVFSSKSYEVTGIFFVDYAKQIFGTIFYILAILGFAKIVTSCLIFATRKGNKKTITLVKLSNSAIRYASWIILVFVLLGIWGVDTGTILASAGIIALIIGLGAQSLIADIIGGLTIVFEEEYEIGDTVVIDGFRGSVYEIGLTATKIVDAAGNLKVIRNSQINTVINLSHDLSVAVTDIDVDYDENLDRVRKIIEEGLPAIGKKIKTIQGKPTYLGVNSFGDSGINIRIIAKCKEEDKFSTTRAMNEAVYNLLQEKKVNIPFPQVVISKRKEK